MITLEERKQFIEYCNEFYNRDTGLYPIATKDQIQHACNAYINAVKDTDLWGNGDSMDRESVRMILQPGYTIFP